ncbi:hypothetical protein [Phytohabitans suffuscus]|uniref:HTH cro/C1-type domain-containing protein n=1 Tax=Phytohabitans suffuscus TaxID=624315 RepID=A0A6F8YZJ1_9ACTN|nr:hypothetical protein [Phytohabitans suffuscus]BCB91600.1 hypothetical protein Psuf_089130 [Phytohabitans suffuscus]
MSRSTIGRMLRGDKVPGVAALRTFLMVCDVTADELPAWLAARERLLVAAKAQRARADREVSRASGDPSWKSDAELIAHILAVGLLPLAEEMLREGAAKRTPPAPRQPR